MTFVPSSFDELTTRLETYHADHAHLLDPEFDPVIDDLEREFAELRCTLPRW
jgi:hypothetical protein